MDAILNNVVSNFKINGEVISIEPYGCGHINTTYLVVTSKQRYILQKINNNLFTNVAKLMENIYLVTNHIKNNYKDKETLTLINTLDDKYYLEHNSGYYRLYDYIEDTVCLQIVTKDEEFYESARGFGEFANMLATFDASKLYEVLANFHNTVSRYNDFIKAVNDNITNKKDNVIDEINFVKDRKEFCSTIVDLLNSKKMPLKVTHNDTKLNNVLLDKNTLKAKAVIDLDTIMPGSICYDFGDSIRFGCNSSLEDDPNLENVYFRIDLFEVYVKGYLSSLAKSITLVEKNNLVNGAIMMTLECGMRFLADYLNGNTYFKVKYEDHNLIRCHTQFKLVSDMEKVKDKMQAIVDKYYDIYCK